MFFFPDHLREVRRRNSKIIRKDFQEKFLSEDCRRTLTKVLLSLLVVVVVVNAVIVVALVESQMMELRTHAAGR